MKKAQDTVKRTNKCFMQVYKSTKAITNPFLSHTYYTGWYFMDIHLICVEEISPVFQLLE